MCEICNQANNFINGGGAVIAVGTAGVICHVARMKLARLRAKRSKNKDVNRNESEKVNN